MGELFGFGWTHNVSFFTICPSTLECLTQSLNSSAAHSAPTLRTNDHLTFRVPSLADVELVAHGCSISETERGFSKERKWDVLCESTLSLRHKYETKSSSPCSDHRNRDQSLDSHAYCRTKDVFCLPSSFSLAPD